MWSPSAAGDDGLFRDQPMAEHFTAVARSSRPSHRSTQARDTIPGTGDSWSISKPYQHTINIALTHDHL